VETFYPYGPGRYNTKDGSVIGRLLGMLNINEIFYSIQGESSHAGRPCVFVRLAACDLHCLWCDTPYASKEGQEMSLDRVLTLVESYGCRLVEITGGEPLLQDEVYALMTALLKRGMTVLLETGGHLSVERVPVGVVKIVDVKCPASGESDRNHWPNLARLAPSDEVKFVVHDRRDYEFARKIIREHDLHNRCATVLLSPVHGALAPKTLAEWMKDDRLPARLQLQVHKYIWEPGTRGV
jgi:7-carboxy-7-deazaguanine synthase